MIGEGKKLAVFGLRLIGWAAVLSAQQNQFTGAWFSEGRQYMVGRVRIEVAFMPGSRLEISRLEFVRGNRDMKVVRRASTSFQVQRDGTIRIRSGRGPGYALARESNKLTLAFIGELGPYRPRDERVAKIWDVVGPIQSMTFAPFAP